MFFPDKMVNRLIDRVWLLFPETSDKFSWAPWFAWYPVYCNRGAERGVVWLERIHRMKTDFRPHYMRRFVGEWMKEQQKGGE